MSGLGLGIGEAAEKNISALQKIPGNIQTAQSNQAQIEAQRGQEKRAKRQAALQDITSFAPALTKEMKRRLLENPAAGDTIIDDMRRENKFLDDSLNSLEIGEGLAKAFINQKGEIGTTFDTPLTEDNIDTFAQKYAAGTGLTIEAAKADLQAGLEQGSSFKQVVSDGKSSVTIAPGTGGAAGLKQTFVTTITEENKPKMEKVAGRTLKVGEELITETEGGQIVGLQDPFTTGQAKTASELSTLEKIKTEEQRNRLISKLTETQKIELNKNFNARIQVKAANKALGAAQAARAALESENPIADNAAIRQLSKLSGEVGVLTDKDVNDFAGSKAAGRRIMQAYETLKSGKFTEANRADMLEMVGILEKVQKKRLNEEGSVFIKSTSQSSGFSVDELTPILKPEFFNAEGVRFGAEEEEATGSTGAAPANFRFNPETGGFDAIEGAQ